MAVLDWMKEIRSWVIMGIVLLVVAGVAGALLKRQKGAITDLKADIAKKEAKIAKLEQDLVAKPHGEITYVCYNKDQVKDPKLCKSSTGPVKPPSIPTQELFNKYCEGCHNEGVDPQITMGAKGFKCTGLLCNLKDGVIIGATCSMTDAGHDVIAANTVNPGSPPAKRSIVRHEVLLGYEVINNGGLIGYSPINYKGLLVGPNLQSDFKTVGGTRAGLFLGYQPQFGESNKKGALKVWKLNIAFGAGISAPLNDFKSYGAEAFVAVPILERAKE